MMVATWLVDAVARFGIDAGSAIRRGMSRFAPGLFWLLLSTAVLAAGAPDDALEARVLYLQYCGSCHGTTGDGHGPVAPILRTPPGDLRRLGVRYGSPVPAERIARFIDGREAVVAHGPREMPVWGERFEAPEPYESGRPASADHRLDKIVAYIQTIQDATLPRARTGGGKR
jgi:mono/diheme cytochrome c family protein